MIRLILHILLLHMHRRKRHIEAVLRKRAGIFPVLGLQGARQVGKSTFLKEQWCNAINASYITFDEIETATRANNYPAQLLNSYTENQSKKLIIDEAQKVPHIFDSVKAFVDNKKRMAAFTLSGSVEFSDKAGVTESLAGRMGITKLYPMTLRELSKQPFAAPWVELDFFSHEPIESKAIDKWIQRGGMPLFCSLDDADERFNLTLSWLDAICYRDINQLKGGRYQGDIAYKVLKYIANKPFFSKSQLAKDLGVDARAFDAHLDALEKLFLLYKLPALGNPRAQPRYVIFDAGVINTLRGVEPNDMTQEDCFISLLLNEIFSQYEYSGKLKPELYHFKTRGGAAIDLVLKANDRLIGIEYVNHVNLTPYQLRGMKSFLNKHQNAQGYVIAPIQSPYKIDDNISVIPWNFIG